MKKLVLTIAIVLGMTFGASAQYFENGNNNGPRQGGGVFGFGATPDYSGNSGSSSPMMPPHNQSDNQDAPLGSGALLLVGFGAAYAMAKKNRKE